MSHAGRRRDRALVAVASAQLAFGCAGAVVAVRRGHAYDLPLLHGRADRVGRDAMILGTALSPPSAMFAIQAAATLRLRRGTSDPASRILGALGAVMVTGYLGERLVRQRLRPGGFEPIESTLAGMGIVLAAAMATLGRRG